MAQTLYDYLMTTDDEVTVWDKDYDIEVYFYNSACDKWDMAMLEIAKQLTIVGNEQDGITVNMAEVIESKLDNTKSLFVSNDIDDIMDSIESILAGNVSEEWLTKFAEALSK